MKITFLFLFIVLFLCLKTSAKNICQDLSNPACPYNYNNTMVDYKEGVPVTIDLELTEFMRTNLQVYLNLIRKQRPPGKLDSPEVFNGVAGRALIFMRLYDRTGNANYLLEAQQYMTTSLNNIDKISKDYVGFLWGKTGVYAVAAVLASLRGDESTANKMIGHVQKIFEQADDDSFAMYDDFDSGRAGLLFAAKFLQNFYDKKNSAVGQTEIISRSSILSVANAIIERGMKVSNDPSFLEWVSPMDGETWLGQSHGSAGILSQLLDIPELLKEGSQTRKLIIGTLDHIVENQFPSGNFPSEYYDASVDKLVQWDHGAPGVLGVLVKASTVLNDSKYLQSAELAADCVWERGLVTKGLMLCHGIMGNTYMQIYLYKMSKNQKYMDRAIKFQEFISQTPDLYDLDYMRIPTPNPFGLYTGSYEPAIMLWVDLLAVKDYDFTTLHMPGYEPAL